MRLPSSTSPHSTAHRPTLQLAILLPSRKGYGLSIPSYYPIDPYSWWVRNVRNLNVLSGNGQHSEKTPVCPSYLFRGADWRTLKPPTPGACGISSTGSVVNFNQSPGKRLSRIVSPRAISARRLRYSFAIDGNHCADSVSFRENPSRDCLTSRPSARDKFQNCGTPGLGYLT